MGARRALLLGAPEQLQPLVEELRGHDLALWLHALPALPEIPDPLALELACRTLLAQAAHSLGGVVTGLVIDTRQAEDAGWEVSTAAWQAQIDRGLTLPWMLGRELLSRLPATEDGRMVLLVDSSASQPDPGRLARTAATAGLLATLRALARLRQPRCTFNALELPSLDAPVARPISVAPVLRHLLLEGGFISGALIPIC
jgi:NAD(P)-dependent dehydrogenase (short-subunit alcohol dehydrogenase family)